MADNLNSLIKLRDYCEKEQYKGWDPFDGLNSKVFNAIPFLNKSAACRLVMIQTFKKLPLNLRRLAMVPKQHNAKGIGLFLQGYCNLYRVVERRPELSVQLGTLDELRCKINEIAEAAILKALLSKRLPK